jgi:hypothetical protein
MVSSSLLVRATCPAERCEISKLRELLRVLQPQPRETIYFALDDLKKVMQGTIMHAVATMEDLTTGAYIRGTSMSVP